MTFTIKHTRSDRPMVAEYLCPVHGRFALEVQRDENGDPPNEMLCDYELVTREEKIANLARRMQQGIPGPTRGLCDELSPFVISKTGTARVRRVEAVRGGYQKPERETWTDTTNLGEGQDLDDWIADRDKVWERDRQREIKELIDG